METTPQNPKATPVKSELPRVESPPISPAVESASARAGRGRNAGHRTQNRIQSRSDARDRTSHGDKPRRVQDRPSQLFVLRPRHKRYALLAASVTFAAALGAIVGALASGGFSAPAKPNVVTIEESKAMQQSIARLGKEVTTLKANLEAANKSAHTQIAKITDRLEHAQADITGSISAPQTTAARRPHWCRHRCRRRDRPHRKFSRLLARRWCRAGPSTILAVATSMWKITARFTRCCSACRCPALAVWNRSSGRTAVGWSRRPGASSCPCATGAISKNSEGSQRTSIETAAPLRAPLFICARGLVASPLKPCQNSSR